MGGRFDLHIHTTASDGLLSPEDTVRAAARAGLWCMAVTDHDTAGGVARAQAEGRRLGLPVIAGAEFSAEADTELHILGYGMDLSSAAYRAFVEDQKQRRRERNAQMLKRLRELGYPMPEEYSPEHTAGEYGRRHMALGMVKAGYSASVRQAFEEYLKTGAPAYVKRRKFKAHELIGAVRAAGGQAVLAHPCRTGLASRELEALAGGLRDMGLCGLEAYYPQHTAEEAERYAGMARRLGLVCTFGSDWHGTPGEGPADGFDRFTIPDGTAEWLNGMIQAGG